MTYPADGPADLERVKTWLSINDDRFDDALEVVVDAVNDVVRGLPILADPDPEPDEFPARVVQGADMLAARVFKRRNSPDGVQAMTDEGASYVSRSDPDVAQLLRIGAYAKPSVG